MGNDKRYRSFRIYVHSTEPEPTQNSEAGVDVQPYKMGVGVNKLVARSQRQQYHDSRLSVLHLGSDNYLLVLSKMAGVSVTAAGIAGFSEHWRGYAVAGLVLVLGTAFVFKDYVIDIYRKARVKRV